MAIALSMAIRTRLDGTKKINQTKEGAGDRHVYGLEKLICLL